MPRPLSACSVAPRRRGRRAIAAAVLVALSALAGCAGGGVPPAAPVSTPAATATASPGPDGVLLRDLGLSDGPLTTFSLPRGAGYDVVVQQPAQVTLVLSAPDPAAVYGYLADALPAAGWTITDADPATATMTFAGHGWTGALTGRTEGTTSASAVLLRLA